MSSHGKTLLRNLGYDVSLDAPVPKTEPVFHQDGLQVLPWEEAEPNVQHSEYKVVLENTDSWWKLELKLVLSDQELHHLAHLVATLAPPFTTIRLQADAHGAGTIFVGLILSFQETRIPVNLVSADIGCGLTLIPCVSKRTGNQTNHSAIPPHDQIEYYSFVLACMRRSLKRGRVAEQGLTTSKYLEEAVAFYGDQELESWLSEMNYVLETIGVEYNCV